MDTVILKFGGSSVADNIKNWLKIASIYALFLSILSFVLGFGYICATGIEESIFYCNNSLMLYGVYSLLKVIIFGLFKYIVYSSGVIFSM